MNKADAIAAIVVILCALGVVHFLYVDNEYHAFLCALGMIASTAIRAAIGGIHEQS